MLISAGSVVFGRDKEEFEVVAFLDGGGFGSVYEARSKKTGEIVALKTLSAPFVDESELAMFSNEAALATEVHHKNVIEYRYFHDGKVYSDLPPYIIMEHADGGNLEKLIQRQIHTGAHFPSKEIVEIFQQLSSGMEAINAKLVHRDIKPSNILLKNGVLKIADFGLAKFAAAATRTLTFKGFGTIPYIAPEAWVGEANSVQMDIYAMGMVFFEIALLRRPFEIPLDDVNGWKDAHLYKSVPNPLVLKPDIGTALAQIIMRMVEKNPKKRMSTWAEVSSLLAKNGSEVVAKNPLLQGMLAKRLQRDADTQAAIAQAEKERAAQSDFCRMALAQAENEIVKPIQGLIDDFNSQYVGMKAHFNKTTISESRVTYQFRMPSSGTLDFNFRVILEKEFYREVTISDFGREIKRTELRLPSINSQKVRCWGTLKASDRRGFNFALLDSGQTYGQWVMLVNKMGVFAREQRLEPFAFEEHEFEKELRILGAMHVYSSHVSPLNVEFVQNFVSEYV